MEIKIKYEKDSKDLNIWGCFILSLAGLLTLPVIAVIGVGAGVEETWKKCKEIYTKLRAKRAEKAEKPAKGKETA